MHLLRGQSRGLEAAEEAVDLGQSPGEIVVLTAADTEIAGLAAARRALAEDFPSVRLANWMALAHPYSVDLYGEQVLAHARLVIVRLLGGVSYWRYGVEEAQRLARAGGLRLAILPGDATWDAGLAEEGTLPADQARRLWSYLAEGGSQNLENALRYAAHLIGRNDAPPGLEPLATAGHYQPTLYRGAMVGAERRGEANADAERSPTAAYPHPAPAGPPFPCGRGSAPSPTAAIIFYRALVQAGQTEPVDALCEAVAERGLKPLPLFVSSLKAAEDAAFVEEALTEADPAVVINATAFALSQAAGDFAGTVLDGGRRPVLQVTFAGTSEAAWAESSRGLSAKDLTMNVVLPEIDGRLITRAVSFKEEGQYDPLTQCRPVRYCPKPDRVAFVAELAERWAALARTPNADKRLAVVLANYPNRDGRIANGVGLDAPESTARLVTALAERGYDVGAAPRTGRALMDVILAGPTNARGSGGRTKSTLPQVERVGAERRGEGTRSRSNGSTVASPHPAASRPPSLSGRGSNARCSGVMLSIPEYLRHFQGLPSDVQQQVEERWGAPEDDPFAADGAFRLPVHRFGNLMIGIQPARGYNVDPKATYHDPDLVPPHGYFAVYIWLREVFGAQAIVQMGKHGNLEWLPGKALALSASCFPEAALGPLPLVYPFIVNDPGEGAQAKRRSSAVVVDHLTPPMARAETYGPAAELERLIDEYASAQAADPRRAGWLAEQIFDLAGAHGFLADLGFAAGERDEAALTRLDEHLCDLKELQIRDGLHVLGQGPESRPRKETLVALARVSRGSGKRGQSILRALAADLGLGAFDPLACAYGEPWVGPRPSLLEEAVEAPWRTNGDTVERLEALALKLVEGRGSEPLPATHAVLDELATRIAPALDASGAREVESVCAALDGRFVPPGPSGAPTRGRPECLPTGRNFYSVDVRAVPTPAAFDLGRRSADMLAERYFQDEGDWPRAIALSAWGTANMRTGGDDIAQALALIGARPVWEPASGRVAGVEVIPLGELGRPRIDVTLRISGFFRDAFPAQIELFHQAVQAVAERDEPADANPIARRIAADAAHLAEAGVPQAEAHKAASFRIFGSKPGAYGAGLQALIDEGIWAERADLAGAFLEWSAYAYGGGAEGQGARGQLERRLAAADAVVHNQDNREHDLLDSDDYYQFEGGLAAAVETLKGAAPRIYHNDHSRPERPMIRALDEEIARVVRGRAANPKWIAGQMRHGYKGAFEMAATVDYLFAFAATTDAVRPHHFEQLYDAYLGDEAVRAFIGDVNAPALAEMAERFREAIDRGLWAPRLNSAYDELTRIAEEARR